MTQTQNSIKTAWQYRRLFMRLVRLKITSKYKGSFLGFFWSLLYPLSFLLIFVFLKSKVFRFNIPNYTIFVITGLWTWSFIHSTIIGSCTAIFEYKDMVQKIPFPKIFLPLSTAAANMAHFMLALPCLYIFMLVTNVPFCKGLILLPFVLILLFCFIAGLACVLSILAVKYRDILHLVEITMRMIFFLTPVFYSISQIPQDCQWIASMNPFHLFISCFRDIIYTNSFIPATKLAVCIALSAASLFLGVILFIKEESKIYYYL